MTTELERALAFEEALLEAAVERIEPNPLGSAVFTDSLPLIWSLNHLRVERTNATGITHKDGTLSMARSTPDTARDSFSIVIGDQPEMDFGGARQPDGQGFAAFGRVVAGMDVVRAIQMGPAKGETLTREVAIVRIRRR